MGVKAERSQGEILEFVETDTTPQITLGLRFLQFLVEEVPPITYLSATLFCLSRSYDSFEIVQPILEILKPLTGSAIAIDINSVCCEGVTLETVVYLEFIEKLERIIGICVADLLGNRGLPEIALWLCSSVGVSFSGLLRKNIGLQKKFGISELIEKVRSREIKEPGVVAGEFIRPGWSRWRVAVLIAAGLISEAKEVVESDGEVKREIIGTPLAELLYGSIQESDFNEGGE
jgi:hypothetical protein